MNILRGKVALIGDPRVGKTGILSQLIRNYFNTTYQTTLGVEYCTFEGKPANIEDYTVQLHILDMTGFSIFRDLVNSNLEDVNYVVYVYDATNLESFQNLKLWRENVKQACKLKKFVEIVVSNKNDLKNKIVVDSGMANSFIGNMKYFETSAVRIAYLYFY
jgi:Ras-related protein Rab-1A